MATRIVPFSQLPIGAEFRFPGGTSHWVKLSPEDYQLAEWESATHPRSRDVHHPDALFGMDVIPAAASPLDRPPAVR